MSTDEPILTFVCPECRQEVPADPRRKRALVRYGCAVCGAAVGEEAFADG